MSQIFHRHANIYARLSMIAVAVVAVSIGGAVALLNVSGYNTKQDEFVEQPIQFSHLHHVGGMGIDCRYCHTSVEESAFANIPPTKTCMNCHSQIWNTAPILEPVRASLRDDTPLHWTRVHDLPDFVYFNHSIHVKKGMGCATCHGPVDKMPLMYQHATLQMSWCLDCHRNPARYIRPREQVFNMSWRPPSDDPDMGARLVKQYKIASVEQLTSCSTCHR
ncbi:MAG: cytochrome C [Acidobacteria bacterium RIFCSPLOWO2_02_FULL_67_36]|nr:MAG: cytochrome C [Acidobacteria bacterium RIFCSPLOWO2_02_FULL_67_36]OFW18581.1 MAG: cytochrome C [Acidobacteria bacterium RIFCSPLOWO2_12_FULL_66_21]